MSWLRAFQTDPSIKATALFMSVTNSDFSENVNSEYLLSLHLTPDCVRAVNYSTESFTIKMPIIMGKDLMLVQMSFL